jgi:SET domain-containing protein
MGRLASRSSPPSPALPDRSTASQPGSATRWVTYRRSAIHGRGVFARRAIPDGTRILEYTGERITKPEAARREVQRLERQRRGGDDSVYIFVINRRHDLDGRTGRNVARFINHSCEPNCRSELSRGRIWIVARREIAAGEELTFDYGFSLKEWRLHPCRCGAKRCAGFIVAKEQRWRLRRIPRAERGRVLVGGARS